MHCHLCSDSRPNCNYVLTVFAKACSNVKLELLVTTVDVQALSGQQFDDDAHQSAYQPVESGSQGHTSGGVKMQDSPSSQRNSPEIAHAVAPAQHYMSADASAGDASNIAQQQTTASNDGGLDAHASYETHQDAAASVHATALEEDVPASDAETDLSSVGLRPSRLQHAQSEPPQCLLMHCKRRC